MQKKLHQLIEDYKILSEKMTDLNIINNVAEYTRLAKEHRKLAPVINKSEEWIIKHTGVHERRISDIDVDKMGAIACSEAIGDKQNPVVCVPWKLGAP